MRTDDDDQHDLIERPQLANPMDDGDVDDVPAALGLVDDCGERLFRHAGIVFERHLHDGVVVVEIAHNADEARHRADFGVTGAQAGNLGTDIEVFGLHAHRHGQPPVTGGKNATSSPSRIDVVACASSWFTATRTPFSRPSADAHVPPLPMRCARNAATVVTSSGSAISSVAVPRSSRSFAKYSSLIIVSTATPKKAGSAPHLRA